MKNGTFIKQFYADYLEERSVEVVTDFNKDFRVGFDGVSVECTGRHLEELYDILKWVLGR